MIQGKDKCSINFKSQIYAEEHEPDDKMELGSYSDLQFLETHAQAKIILRYIPYLKATATLHLVTQRLNSSDKGAALSILSSV